MPFIGRGGSSPPPDTTTGAKAPDPGAFALRVRPGRRDRAPEPGSPARPVDWSGGPFGATGLTVPAVSSPAVASSVGAIAAVESGSAAALARAVATVLSDVLSGGLAVPTGEGAPHGRPIIVALVMALTPAPGVSVVEVSGVEVSSTGASS